MRTDAAQNLFCGCATTEVSSREVKSTMIEYPPVDLAIREIGNGMWACLGAFMVGFFVWYAHRWRAYIMTDATVAGAMALALYFAGTAVRAFLAWGAVASARRAYWPADPWLGSWPWYAPSVFVSVIGAAWCVWVFTPVGKVVVVLGLFAIALLLPVMGYVLL
jgi:hypothetical protein